MERHFYESVKQPNFDTMVDKWIKRLYNGSITAEDNDF